MPKQKQTKKTPSGTRGFRNISFFERRPLLGYTIITLCLMAFVFFAEQGTEFYRASILEIPKFDGTALPVKKIPDWEKTGGANTKLYDEYSSSDFIAIPEYDASKLKKKCSDENTSYTNACTTYTTVYMGNYLMDHTEYGGSHLAVDIRIPIGTPVYAVANGVVEKAVSQITGFGRYIVVKHPNAPLIDGGTETLFSGYAHLSKVLVEEGDMIKKGDLIGYSGNTGIATTPHLHFQIDRNSAPYHPWWPFTTAQASNANLNFFEAIDAGIGQEEAIENTINPMPWVQEYLNFSGDALSDGSSTDSENSGEKETVGRIVVKANTSSALPGETVTFLVTVLDVQKQVFEEYDGKSFTVTSSGTEKIPHVPFANGKAEIPVIMKKSGETLFTFRDGKKSDEVTITVKEADDPSVTTAPETEVNIPETIEDSNAVASVEWKVGEDIIRTNKRTTVTVTLLNNNGDVLTEASFSDPLQVQLSGDGEINPKQLLPRYFTNGTATIEYFAGKNAGAAKISLEKYPNTSANITVIEAPQEVAGFSVETDERFQIGKPETVSITTIDKNGNRTPNGFLGEADITVISGKAKITPETLSEKDFVNGKAEVELIPLSKDNIVIKIKSGVLVGTSDKLQEGEEKTITGTTTLLFSDIPANFKNYTAISFLKDAGILSGNADGTFRPNGNINRAEFAKVVLLALNKEPTSARGNVFSDVPKNAWYAPYVETAAELGIIEGYPDGSFRPAENINRAELFTMLARSFNGLEITGKNSFTDVPENIWYEEAATFAKEKKLLDFGTQFKPAEIMTRAEVAEAVFRVLNL